MNFRELKSPEERLHSALTNAICLVVRANGGIRIRNPLSYLQYSMEELRSYLEARWEPWMSWDNWGVFKKNIRTWQIDHIIPQSKLPYDDVPHPNFYSCWQLSNLRPLESAANFSKGNRIK